MDYQVNLLKADGDQLSKKELNSVYLSDMQFRPLKKEKDLGEGTVYIAGHDGPVIIHARIPVMDFGYVWVIADNEGRGYAGEKVEIDFVKEAVFSRLAEIENIRDSYSGELSPKTAAHIEAAEKYLQLAQKEQGKEKNELYHRALSHGLQGGELALLEQARDYKRSAPAPELGCNAFRYEPGSDYASYFADVFDFATLPFYLSEGLAEEKRGEPDYSKVDKILSWCKEKGITPKGHPLWWNHEAGTPSWLREVNWETMKKECVRTVKRSVERYKDEIQIWDVVNEVHDWANLNPLPREQLVEITKIACETAREANPDATLIVNNCLPFGEYAAQGLEVCPYSNLSEERELFSPLTFLEALIENDVPFDVIGIQLYFPARDMVSISRLLDEYIKLGKPVHITELGVSSGDSHTDWQEVDSERTTYPTSHLYGTGTWHTEWEWSEKIQADWLEWFYTLAYSKEEIEAIIWWDLQDPAYVPNSGLIRENGIPKEAYFRLKECQKRWQGTER
ncbi:MAG: endo-1,4-beta-xylanase [Bacillota bacterium]